MFLDFSIIIRFWPKFAHIPICRHNPITGNVGNVNHVCTAQWNIKYRVVLRIIQVCRQQRLCWHSIVGHSIGPRWFSSCCARRDHGSVFVDTFGCAGNVDGLEQRMWESVARHSSTPAAHTCGPAGNVTRKPCGREPSNLWYALGILCWRSWQFVLTFYWNSLFTGSWEFLLKGPAILCRELRCDCVM